MTKDKGQISDVLIIGGGVIGLAAARALSRKGVRQITLLERGALGREASHAAAGMLAPNAETAQAAFFPISAVLVFASAAFVPVDTMPDWLQPFARNQPVSQVIAAARALTLGGPTAGHVVSALLWIGGLTVVFAWLAIRRYRKVA